MTNDYELKKRAILQELQEEERTRENAARVARALELQQQLQENEQRRYVANLVQVSVQPSKDPTCIGQKLPEDSTIEALTADEIARRLVSYNKW